MTQITITSPGYTSDIYVEVPGEVATNDRRLQPYARSIVESRGRMYVGGTFAFVTPDCPDVNPAATDVDGFVLECLECGSEILEGESYAEHSQRIAGVNRTITGHAHTDCLL